MSLLSEHCAYFVFNQFRNSRVISPMKYKVHVRINFIRINIIFFTYNYKHYIVIKKKSKR